MPKNPLQKNRLTKLQNPALALAIATEMQIFIGILTSSLMIVENVGAEPVAVAIVKARLPIIYQLVE